MASKIALIISVQLRKTAQIIYVLCATTNITIANINKLYNPLFRIRTYLDGSGFSITICLAFKHRSAYLMKCHPHRAAATYAYSWTLLELWCSDSSVECSLFYCHFVDRWRSATSRENHMLFTVDAALRHSRKSICLPVPFVLYYRRIEWNNNVPAVNHRYWRTCGICICS